MTESDEISLVLAQASDFADDITALLANSLPGAPAAHVIQIGDRIKIAPEGQTEKHAGVPLAVDGEVLAWLRIDFLCRLDAARQYMAIDSSKIWVVADVDSTPIFRFEYLYEADWVPHSHIQVHGERGALSHLMSRTGHPRPHVMSSLHLPTGGARFRPNLEDVIQFLIVDCRFDSVNTWQAAVDERRAAWRRIQLRTAVRAMASEAAEQLTAMGYEVTPPPDGHPPAGQKAQFAW